MKLNPDYSQSQFVALPVGRHKAKITEAKFVKNEQYGDKIAWKLQTFGSVNKSMNGRYIFHNTPIAGEFAGLLSVFIRAIDPTYDPNKNAEFDTDDFIGKNVEVEIVYAKKRDGTFSEYPTVKKTFPYVESNSAIDPIEFPG